VEIFAFLVTKPARRAAILALHPAIFAAYRSLRRKKIPVISID
jgi:hypothetical protein